MADSVAFEAKLLVAFETIVRILTAEDAVGAGSLVGTVNRKVPEFQAITALNGRIVFMVVTNDLVTQLVEFFVALFV